MLLIILTLTTTASYSLNYQNSFLDSQNKELIVYFDSNPIDSLEVEIEFGADFYYKDLFSDSTPHNSQENWVREYPLVSQNSMILPQSLEKRRYKLILGYNDINFSNLQSNSISFFQNSALIKNVSFERLKYSQADKTLEIGMPIDGFGVCSYSNDSYISCSADSFVLTDNKTKHIEMPLFNNGSRIVNLTSIDFSVSPSTAATISGNIGASFMKSSSLLSPDNIISYGSNKLNLIDISNLSSSLWQSSSIFGITDIAEGNFSNYGNSIIFITGSGVWIDNTLQTKKLSSVGGSAIEPSVVYSNSTVFAHSIGEVFDYEVLSNTRNLRYDFDPSWILDAGASCSLLLGLNRVGSPENITLNISGTQYDVNANWVVDNLYNINSLYDEDAESVILLGNSSLEFENPRDNYMAKSCNVRFGVGSYGDTTGSEFKADIGSGTFIFDKSSIKNINLTRFKFTENTNIINTLKIGPESVNAIRINNSWTTNNSLCNLEIGLNYNGVKNDIYLVSDDYNYKIDVDAITQDTAHIFKGFSSNQNKGRFDVGVEDIVYFSDLSNMNSIICDVDVALNYKGDNNDLGLQIAGDGNYVFNLDNLSTDNVEEKTYPGTNWSKSYSFDIGKTNDVEVDNLLVRTLNLYSNLDDYNTCYLKMNLCYNGSSQNKLEVFVSSTYFNISSSDLSSCSSPSDYLFPLNCSLLNSNSDIFLTCVDCDSANYFSLSGNNNSNGVSNSIFTFGTGVTLRSSDTKYDPLFSVYTNESLAYDVFNFSIPCSELENSNITLSCINCTSSNTVNIITAKEQGDTYRFGSLEDEDILMKVSSDESYLYSLLFEPVDCSAILDKNFSLQCPSCDEDNYYSLPLINSSSQSVSVYNGSNWEFVSGAPLIRVSSFDYTNDSYVEVDMNCSELNGNDFKLYCSGCDEDNSFVLFNDMNTSGSLIYDDDNMVAGNLFYDVFSSTSLDYSSVVLNDISCSALNESVFLSCPSCDAGNYFNVLKVNQSSSHSGYKQGASYTNITDGDLKIVVQQFSRIPGNGYVIIDTSGSLKAYDSNGINLFTKTIDGFAYRELYVKDFLPLYLGYEIFFTNSTSIVIYTSSGDKLFTVDGLNYPKMIASDNYLLVVDKNLKYKVYDNKLNLIKSHTLTGVGLEPVKIIKGNLMDETSQEEYIIVSQGVDSHYFTIMDSEFNKIYSYTFPGNLNDVFISGLYPNSLVVSDNSNISVFPLSPIKELKILLNGTEIYSSNGYITQELSISSLTSFFRNYVNSLSFSGDSHILIPLRFDFYQSITSILSSVDMLFEVDTSPLVTVESYNGIASTNKLVANSGYFTSGSRLVYTNDFIPFRITNISGLLGYFGTQYDLYDQNGNLLGTCSDSSGSVAMLGTISSRGIDIGCNLGYYVDSGRDYDIFMYGSQVRPILSSGPAFTGGAVNDLKSYSIYVNSSFSSYNFTNTYLSIDSLDTSSYSSSYLRVKKNSTYLATLNASLNPDCYADEYIGGDNSILDKYFAKTIFDGKQIYVCSEALSAETYKHHIILSEIRYNENYAFESVGVKNIVPVLSNVDVNKSPVFWSEPFSVTGSFNDSNKDFINITLQFLNPSSSSWVNYSTLSFAASQGDFNFSNTVLSKDYVTNTNYYRFLIEDYDNSTLLLKEQTYTNSYQFDLNDIPVGFNSLDTGFSSEFSVDIYNNYTLNPLSGTVCKYYFYNNGTYVLQATAISNSSGVCRYDMPSSYLPGTYYYYVIAEKDGFVSTTSETFNHTLKRSLSLYVSAPDSLKRTELMDVNARLIDSNMNLVEESGISCMLYINGSFVLSRSTNSNGECNFNNLALGCSYDIGETALRIDVSGIDTGRYIEPSFSYNDTFTLTDTASVSIIEPDNSISYNPFDTINLSANIIDSCGNDISENNDFYWQYEEIDSGDKSIISSNLIDTWILPEHIYGSVRINAIYQNLSYGGKFTDSKMLMVQDVLNAQYVGNTSFLRIPSSTGELEAQIVTGNGIYVNESSYIGTWSGYNCSWYLDDGNLAEYLGTSVTDATGHCSLSYNIGCARLLGDYTIIVNMSGDVTPEYPLFDKIDDEEIIFYDDFSAGNISIDNLSYTNVTDLLFFAEEYTLGYSLSDSCGNDQRALYDVIWDYVSDSRNITINLGDSDNITFIPNSMMRGLSKIRLSIKNSEYILNTNKNESIHVGRTAQLSSITVPEYLIKDAVNQFSCQVSIPGLNNLSFYGVEFSVDNSSFNVSTNQNGLAVLNFDTTGFSQGVHLVECRIYNYSDVDYYVEVQSNSLLNDTTTLPSDLSIYNSAVFIGNREYDMTKSTVGNPTYPVGMSYEKIFRRSIYPMYEPKYLYIGIGYSTIGAQGTPFEGVQIPVSGINVTAHFIKNSTGVVMDTLSCIQDVEEYDNRMPDDPRDLIDSYNSDYICLMKWTPGEIPVGEYQVVINATVNNQSGWTSEVYNGSFEVWGISNTTISNPSANEFITADGSHTLKANVKDEFGNSLNSDNISVRYFLRDRTYNCKGTSIGTVSGTSDDEFTLNNFMPDSVSNSVTDPERVAHGWGIQAISYGDFYEDENMKTSYETSSYNNCDYFYLEKPMYDENIIHIDYPSNASFIYPTGSVIAPDTTGEHIGKISFGCKAVTHDDSIIRGVPINLSCNGCASVPTNLRITTDYSGYSYFYVTPDDTDYGKKFNFTCALDSSYTLGGNHILGTNNGLIEVTIVEELGSGWGDLPQNFTFPTVTVKVYEDALCTVERTWFQRGGSSPYIGFDVTKGSDDLNFYTLTKIEGAGPGFIDEDYLNSESDSRCIQYSTGTGELDGIENYKMELVIKDANNIELAKTVEFKMDDVAPEINSLSFDKSAYAASQSATLSVSLDPSSVNVEGFADISSVMVRLLPAGSWDSLSKVTEDNWTRTVTTNTTGGIYNYEVTVTDFAGFSDTANTSLIVDALPPVIDYYNLSSGCGGSVDHVLGYACRPNVDFIINSSDDINIKRVRVVGTGAIGTLLDVDNVASQNYSNNLTVDLWAMPEGEYTINYYVYDYVDHSEQESLPFIVKKTAPSLSTLVVDKGFVNSTSDTITFTGTITQTLPFLVASLDIGPNRVCSNVSTCNVNYNGYDLSGFSEGDNEIRSLSFDNVGNNASKDFNIILDTIKPVVNITTPSELFIRGNIVVGADVTDANRDNANIDYVLGSCSANLNLVVGNHFEKTGVSTSSCGADGNYSLNVSATDKAGNYFADSIQVTIDNTDPDVTVIKPATDENIASASYQIVVEVSESNLDYSVYKIDSSSYSNMTCVPVSGILQNCTADLNTLSYSDGSHVLYVKAYDKAGASKEVTVNFKIDNEPPEITWTKLKNSDGTEYTSAFTDKKVGGLINIYSDIIDEGGNGDPSTYKCYADGSFVSDMVVNSGNNYVCDIDTISYSGTTFFEVRANDTGDKMGSQGYNLNVDNVAPSFNIFNISPVLLKTNDMISLDITADENLKGNCEIYYSIDGVTPIMPALTNIGSGGTASCSGSFAMTQGAGTSGVRYIIANITDLVGNKNSSNVSFELDNTLPTINISNPLDNETIGGENYLISVQVVETNLDYVSYNIDGGAWSDMNCVLNGDYNCSSLINTSDFNDGSHTLNIKAADLAGNVKTDSVVFRTDASAPEITLQKIVIGDGTEYLNNFDNRSVGGNVYLHAHIVDLSLNGDPSTYNCYVDGDYIMTMDSLGSDVYRCLVDTTLYPEVLTTFRITANDTVGWSNFYDVDLYIDNTAPVFNSYTINPTLMKTGDSVNLSINTNEDLKGNCEVFYSTDGVALTSFISNISLTTSTSCIGSFVMNKGSGISGTRYIISRIRDTVGNVNTDVHIFELDNHAPVVNITSPLPNAVIGGVYSIHADVAEENLDFARYKIDAGSFSNMNCDISSNSNCSISFDTTLYADGDYQIFVEALDLVGLSSGLVPVDVNIDNQPPSITIDKIINSDGTEYTAGFNGSYVSSDIKLYADINDLAGNGNVSSYRCYANGIFVSSMSGLGGDEYYCNISTSLYVGLTNFSVRASDYVPLNNEKIVELFVDNMHPAFTSFTLSPLLVKTGSVMNVSVVSDENLKGNCEVYYSTDGINTLGSVLVNLSSVSNQCSGSFVLNRDGMNSGYRYIIVNITDLAGNSNVSEHQFFLDNQAPQISNFNLTNSFAPRPETNNLPSVSPSKIGLWVVDATDNSQGVGGNISEIYLRIVDSESPMYNASHRHDFVNYSLNSYNATASALSFNATNGTTVFQVYAVDSLGNVAMRNLTIYITSSPPVIDNVTAEPDYLEVNLASTNISLNITAAGEFVSFMIVNVTRPNGVVDSYRFENSPGADYNITKEGGLHYFTYTPSIVGTYNITTYVENLAYVYSVSQFSDVFETVGKTVGVLSYAPEAVNISSLEYGSPYRFNLSINLSNTGYATMRDSKVQFSGVGMTTNLTSGYHNCGTVSNGSVCSFDIEVSVTNAIGSGTKSLFIITDWLDSDNTRSNFLSRKVDINIEDSNKIDILTDEISSDNIEQSIEKSLGSIFVRNNGNTIFDNVVFNVQNGTIDNPSISFDFSPASVSTLGINEIQEVDINVTSLIKGNYNGYLAANASCTSSGCSDIIFVNLSFYDKINQTIINPANNLNVSRADLGGFMPFNCSLTSIYDGFDLSSHPTDIIKEDGEGQIKLATLNTTLNGRANYLINLSQIEPGDMTFICRGQNNLGNYIRESTYGNSRVNVTLNGELDGEFAFTYPSTCIGSLYWYDTHLCNNVNLSATVIDEFGNFVEDANVTFYTNATDDFSQEVIGNCYTQINGKCEVNWNPNVSVQGLYGVGANFSKNKYYEDDISSKNITVSGGYYVEIKSPLGNNLLHGNSYLLNLSVKDTDGSEITDTLTYNTTWSLYRNSTLVSVLSTDKAYNWTINSSFLGRYLLNVTIDSVNGSVSNVHNITIQRDSLDVAITSNSNFEIFRESSNSSHILNTTLTVEVIDNVTGSPLEDASMSFWLNELLNIGNCQTDAAGACSILWNPETNLEAGYYNVTVRANKEYYIEQSDVTSNIVKVFVEPKWLTAGAYSDSITNSFNIPLSCEIIESYKTNNNPLEIFAVDFYMLTPAIFDVLTLRSVPYIDSVQYNWDSASALNVSELPSGQGLFADFNNMANISLYSGGIPTSNLNLQGYDTISVSFKDLGIGVSWSLHGLNESGSYEEIIAPNSNLTYSAFIGEGNIYDNVMFALTAAGAGNATFDYITLEQTINENVIEIGAPTVLGNEFSGANLFLRGDFESFVIPKTPGFNALGSVDLSPSNDYSADGVQSLDMYLEDLAVGDRAGFVWSTGMNYDVSDYVSMFVTLFNPDNLTLSGKIVLASVGCSEEYDFGNLSSKLVYPDINISSYVDTCGNNVRNISLQLFNVGSSEITGDVYVDRIELMRKVVTSNGIASIDFHPHDSGKYRFACNISNSTLYKARVSRLEKVVEIISTTSATEGEQTGGSSDSIGETPMNGSVLTFELDLMESSYIVPQDGLGLLVDFTIFNKLNADRVFNVSSDNPDILFVNSYEESSSLVQLSGNSRMSKKVKIYINLSGELSDSIDLSLSVKDVSRDEEIKVPIHLSVVPIHVSIIAPSSGSPYTDVLPLEDVIVLGDVEFNNSASYDSLLESFTYRVYTRGDTIINECVMNNYNVTNGVLELNCSEPFGSGNLLQDTVLRVVFGGEN